MAGISFLYEEYQKNPMRVEKMLESEIEISEKLDGSRFQVQKDASGALNFYKRKDIAITRIDRTLSRYYEKAVNHFENLSEDKVLQMPEGWRFGMEYFPNLQPVTVSYDRLPLNNLVLTDIQVRDPKDRILDIITDEKTLRNWSTVLEVENPPIIFEGKLTKEQKDKILQFLNTPYADLITRFKTENFTSFILKLLNPELKNSFMNSDITKDIDGLIFKFDGKEAFRVSNPEVTFKKAEKKVEKPSDIYSLTLMILHEFITSVDFSKVKLKSSSFEDRYIEFVSKVFNMFVKSPIYREHFENEVDFDLPKFLTREESQVNFKFVTDPETIDFLQRSNTNRELFKILLASLRTHKKKPMGFFTKELISHHNSLVDRVADYINANNSLKENLSFFTFEEFRKTFLTESENWSEEFGKESPDEIEQYKDFPSFQDVSKPRRDPEAPIKVLSKLFSSQDTSDVKSKSKPVCIMKGKFQPFHNGHLTSIDDAAKESGMKVFIVVMRRRLDEKFSEELHKAIIDEMKAHKNIAGYAFSDGSSISQIKKDLPTKFHVAAFAGNDEECQDVKAELGMDFPTYTMTKHIKTSSVMDKIKSEDYDSYKKLVPKQLHNYFYKIKNELASE
jgi:nicotinamide mononucleotide adenylyltransferase